MDVVTMRLQAGTLARSLARVNQCAYFAHDPQFPRLNALMWMSRARDYRRSGMHDSAAVCRADARRRLAEYPGALRALKAYL